MIASSVRPRAALVSLLLLVAVPAAATAAPPRQPRQVGSDYVVVLRDGVTRPSETTDELERRRGFRARHRYGKAVKGFSATLSASQARQLRDDPEVAYVAPDRPVRATGFVAVAGGELLPVGLRRVEAATSTTVRQAATRDVAVLDTGVAATADLTLTGGVDCTGGGTTQDRHGHGTHVAGTIAGRNTGSGVVGVAPGTRLHPVKVLDDQGSGAWSSIICGLDYVAGTRTDADALNDVAVANLSLGGVGDPVGSCGTTSDPLHQAICDVTAAGVLVVVAAGNDGWDFDYASAPDVPAAYPEVLTVSAMADTDGRGGALGAAPSCRSGEADDRYAAFSNYARTSAGLAHLIAAPGVCIASSSITGGLATMSGTSMATPHVAGVAALCFGEAGAAGPCAGLTAAQAMARLRSDAQARSTAESSYGFTGDPARPVSRGAFGYLVNLPGAPAPVSQTGSPAPSWSLVTGTWRSGGNASLTADDGSLLTIASTGSGTRTTAWTGRFAGVPGTLRSLRLQLRSRSSSSCSQVLALLQPASGTWTTLDQRTLGTSEVLADRSAGGTLSSYVSAAGEVVARVRCTNGSRTFEHRTDQLKLTWTT